MEEKTFYKSRGHWFASKEEAEEWDKRIEAEEKEVYEFLFEMLDSYFYDVYSEKELDEQHEELKALGVTEKDIDKYEAGMPSKLLDDFFDKLPTTHLSKAVKKLRPSQFLRFMRSIEEFSDIYLRDEHFVFKEEYVYRGPKSGFTKGEENDFIDWLKAHEINDPPPDQINKPWLWDKTYQKDEGNIGERKSPL